MHIPHYLFPAIPGDGFDRVPSVLATRVEGGGWRYNSAETGAFAAGLDFGRSVERRSPATTAQRELRPPGRSPAITAQQELRPPGRSPATTAQQELRPPGRSPATTAQQELRPPGRSPAITAQQELRPSPGLATRRHQDSPFVVGIWEYLTNPGIFMQVNRGSCGSSLGKGPG